MRRCAGRSAPQCTVARPRGDFAYARRKRTEQRVARRQRPPGDDEPQLLASTKQRRRRTESDGDLNDFAGRNGCSSAHVGTGSQGRDDDGSRCRSATRDKPVATRSRPYPNDPSNGTYRPSRHFSTPTNRLASWQPWSSSHNFADIGPVTSVSAVNVQLKAAACCLSPNVMLPGSVGGRSLSAPP